MQEGRSKRSNRNKRRLILYLELNIRKYQCKHTCSNAPRSITQNNIECTPTHTKKTKELSKKNKNITCCLQL